MTKPGNGDKKPVGTPPSKLWQPGSEDPDEELITLHQLSIELRKRCIIDKSPKTLYEWTVRGLKGRAPGSETYTLKTQAVGRARYSTVRWVREFLAVFGDDAPPGVFPYPHQLRENRLKRQKQKQKKP